ncbi:CaiB/BaiF CoA transferase family protein [Biostraticola tofi]|uniref:Crotonobetainyl-CoA:carnitine CoA-transferase CaiB-like acyl-CoA transferase n=1 Tax=Biostraticola tofi TaxID=466109 RepID=A0A4R3YRJ5_9GAMM|nr:CaiB/BaiF CoA-transferase family protein [Biostraticola tofi]TCV94278.1 crotonobetainyl-CoA:carnitine CoA-transferase CaiB-like acyl-CoA transferase [Biostraticola tofi]
MKPLAGINVLDFSQFLSGPSAALRLADLGAAVTKIENPDGGDICRRLYISALQIDGDSSLFHAINRNKKSITVDLKNAAQHDALLPLIQNADVVIFNFRPGVASRLGLDYRSLKAINPAIIYGEISGYGDEGPWVKRPGQDLLIQALSGLCHLNGDASQPPLPFGLSVTDIFAGDYLVQGIMAGLVKRITSGCGCQVQVSLLDTVLDLQFEVLTTWMNDGQQDPVRSAVNNANAYLSAPYGIYPTARGYLALAMTPIPRLGELLGCPALTTYTQPDTWFSYRDEIKTLLIDHLQTKDCDSWLSILEQEDIWCAKVMDWEQLYASEGFKALKMVQQLTLPSGKSLLTTRCPIKIDGDVFLSPVGAPPLGADNP